MKINLLLSGMLLAGTAFSLCAAHITPQQALQRVESSKSLRALKGKLPENPQFDSTIGNLYIFTSSKGYMVLPADDQSPALLAYSDHAGFSLADNPGLRYWLDFYNAELGAALKETKTKVIKAVRPTREAIAPLTKTRWNQESPYNDDCPEMDGKRTVTGCVATAMAQVMKYHSYPAKGKGSHSYNWEDGGKDLTCDFSTTTFEWDKMSNVYDSESSAESRSAVATLMSACGISVDMNYGVDESSASSIQMGLSLVDYFDYDRGLWMPMRDYYGLYEWEDMIYSDLSEGLPVLYSGRGTAGGHQFICDGYSGDGYFHFNWGWGGMSDGYFLLSALNPANLGVGGGAGGFNSNQMVTLGVRPLQEGSKPKYLMYNIQEFGTTMSQVSAGAWLECTGAFENLSIVPMPTGSYLGMKITPSDGGEAQFVTGFEIDGLPVSSFYKEDVIKFPALEDGDYVITPAFYDGTKWAEIPTALDMTGKLLAKVSNNTAILSTPQIMEIEVTDISVPSPVYIGRNFAMSFTVSNPNSEEYVGKVIPLLFSSTGQEVAQSVYRPVDILGESEEKVTDYVGNFQSTNNEQLTPGNYFLVFFDENENQISEQTPVTLQTAPAETTISVSGLTLISSDPVKDRVNVEFSFNVACTKGYFSSALRLFIFPSTGGTSLLGKASDAIFLNSGEEKKVNMTMDLSSLNPGRYMAAVFNGNSPASQSIYFEIADIPTGLTEISDSENDVQVIYNMQGIKCQEPLIPGLYIINGKKILVE